MILDKVHSIRFFYFSYFQQKTEDLSIWRNLVTWLWINRFELFKVLKSSTFNFISDLFCKSLCPKFLTFTQEDLQLFEKKWLQLTLNFEERESLWKSCSLFKWKMQIFHCVFSSLSGKDLCALFGSFFVRPMRCCEICP